MRIQEKIEDLYSLINRVYATGQNQRKSFCLTLRLLNGILYPRLSFLAMPAQYPAGKALLHTEQESAFLNSRSCVARDPKITERKENSVSLVCGSST